MQIVLGCAVGWASMLLLGHGVVAGVGLGRPGARLAQALQALADLEDGPVDGVLHGVEAAQGGRGWQGGVGGVAQAARLPGLVGCHLREASLRVGVLVIRGEDLLVLQGAVHGKPAAFYYVASFLVDAHCIRYIIQIFHLLHLHQGWCRGGG